MGPVDAPPVPLPRTRWTRGRPTLARPSHLLSGPAAAPCLVDSGAPGDENRCTTIIGVRCSGAEIHTACNRLACRHPLPCVTHHLAHPVMSSELACPRVEALNALFGGLKPVSNVGHLAPEQFYALMRVRSVKCAQTQLPYGAGRTLPRWRDAAALRDSRAVISSLTARMGSSRGAAGRLSRSTARRRSAALARSSRPASTFASCAHARA